MTRIGGLFSNPLLMFLSVDSKWLGLEESGCDSLHSGWSVPKMSRKHEVPVGHTQDLAKEGPEAGCGDTHM